MKRLLLLPFLFLLPAMTAVAQTDDYPPHLTGLKGIRQCIERFSNVPAGPQQLQAIHYVDAHGSDTAIQAYLSDTVLAGRTVIRYAGGLISSCRQYGGTDYDDTGFRYNPFLLQSETTYTYQDGRLIHSRKTDVHGGTSDRYLSYDSLGRRQTALTVDYAEGVTYSYRMHGKIVTTDRDTMIRTYRYSGEMVTEQFRHAGTPDHYRRYTYDHQGRLLEMADQNGQGRITGTESYRYDGQGRLAEVRYGRSGQPLPRGFIPFTRQEYRYDQAGRRSEQISYSGSAITRLIYTYVR